MYYNPHSTTSTRSRNRIQVLQALPSIAKLRLTSGCHVKMNICELVEAVAYARQAWSVETYQTSERMICRDEGYITLGRLRLK
jgi:hypothetical protein